jgi:hypothetical protein
MDEMDLMDEMDGAGSERTFRSEKLAELGLRVPGKDSQDGDGLRQNPGCRP